MLSLVVAVLYSPMAGVMELWLSCYSDFFFFSAPFLLRNLPILSPILILFFPVLASIKISNLLLESILPPDYE